MLVAMPAPRFHPFVRLLFCALGLIGVQILLDVLLYVASALSTPWTNQFPTEQLADFTTRFALPLTVLSYPASLGWMAFCRRKFDACSLASLGLRSRRAGSDMGRGMATGALAIALLWLILWLTGMISVAGWSQIARQNGVGISILSLLGYGLAFFAVGFFEETLFRGYMLHNLNAWLGWRGAVALQAILFALVHLGNVINADAGHKAAALGALPSLFLIAVFFALSYRKTGSLWFPIGFHFAWNFCLGCVFSLPVSGIETFRLLDVQANNQSWFSGGTFGAEGSFYLIPILLALIYTVSKAPDHPQAALDLALLHRRAEIVTPIQILTETEDEMPEEERESRYSTKFGTSQGFSADTLRELRELQEAREREQTEARDAARREALSQLNAAPAVVDAPAASMETPILAPVLAPETTLMVAEVSSAELGAQNLQETPQAKAPEPQSVPDVEKAPVSEAPAKPKPSKPRW